MKFLQPFLWTVWFATVPAGADELPTSSCTCCARPRSKGNQRSDYGAFCASWDAADEKPWCAVCSAAACGEDDTFESDRGQYWSRRPCERMSKRPPPAQVWSEARTGQPGAPSRDTSCSCPYSDEYVRSLFARAPARIQRNAVRATYERLATRTLGDEYSLLRIRDGTLSAGHNRQRYASRKSVIVTTIEAILSKNRTALPDMELIINSFDMTVDTHCNRKMGLLEMARGCTFPNESVPIFATCSDTLCKLDVPIPIGLPGLLRGSFEGFGFPLASRESDGIGQDILLDGGAVSGFALQDVTLAKWAQRKPQAVWRGTARYYGRKTCPSTHMVVPALKALHSAGGTSGKKDWLPAGTFDRQHPRYALRELSHKRPDIVDAEFTNLLLEQAHSRSHVGQTFPARKSKRMGWKDLMQFKYQVAADGNSYATGFGGLLLLGSVVLRHESTMNLWFEGMLEDGKDFIKVKPDFSDLAEKIEWLRAHDQEAEAIARSGQRKAQLLLAYASLECFVTKLLLHYASLLVE